MDCWAGAFLDPPGAAPGRLHVLVMEGPGGELLGVAPLYVDRSGDSRRSTLRVLGDLHVCSDYLDFPVAAGHELAFADALTHELRRAPAPGALALAAVPDDSFIRESLLPRLASAGLWSIEMSRFSCPILALGPDFEGAYNRKFSKLRKMGNVSLGHGGTVDDTLAGLQDLFRLHQANWTRRGEPGSFDTEEKRSFYRELARCLVPMDRLRLYSLKVDGVTVAANLGFSLDGEWYGMQAGYDEEWSKHSVGAILQGQLLQGLISEGFRRMHFLRGGEPYKHQHWGAIDQFQAELCVFRPGVVTLSRYYAPHMARRLRRLVRTWTRPRVAPIGNDAHRHPGAPASPR